MSAERGALLLRIARQAIESALGRDPAGVEDPPWLNAPGASFVTLRQGGELRGCIGTLEARYALARDVAANAVNAAFRDSRFSPLQESDLGSTEVEVSVLSPMEPLAFRSEEDAIAQLRPGVDGVVLEYRGQRGTFLPQVWEDLSDPRDFLGHLKRKAGLPADFWSPEVRLYRYTVAKYRESDFAEAASS